MIATLNYRGVFVASRQTKIRQHCRRTVVVVPLQRRGGPNELNVDSCSRYLNWKRLKFWLSWGKICSAYTFWDEKLEEFFRSRLMLDSIG